MVCVYLLAPQSLARPCYDAKGEGLRRQGRRWRLGLRRQGRRYDKRGEKKGARSGRAAAARRGGG